MPRKATKPPVQTIPIYDPTGFVEHVDEHVRQAHANLTKAGESGGLIITDGWDNAAVNGFIKGLRTLNGTDYRMTYRKGTAPDGRDALRIVIKPVERKE